MRMRVALCAAAWCSLAFSQTPNAPSTPAAQIEVYDGFEQPQLSNLWETSRFVPGTVVMESHIVRAGHQAAVITVHSRDEFETGLHGNSDSERTELLEARRFTSHENVPYEFRFSMFFPADFPIVPTRLVIAQWKQFCPDSSLPCSDDSPVLALRYIGGELRVTQDLGGKQMVLYRERAEFRGRWLDFRVRTRFTPTGDGHVAVWLADRRLIEIRGITANAEDASTGYKTPGFFYFKMGLYRNVMDAPMTVYIDEYHKQQLRSDEF
jgi:hypothetical protein